MILRAFGIHPIVPGGKRMMPEARKAVCCAYVALKIILKDVCTCEKKKQAIFFGSINSQKL
jgi:hypothetical protein